MVEVRTAHRCIFIIDVCTSLKCRKKHASLLYISAMVYSSINLTATPKSTTISPILYSQIRTYLLSDYKMTPSSPDPEGKTRTRSPHPISVGEFLSTPKSSFPPPFSRQSLPSNSLKRELSPPPLRSKRNSLPGRSTISLSHALSSPQKSRSHPTDRDGFSIPKPVMRLLLFLAVVGTGYLLLVRASAVKTPLLRAAIRRDVGDNGYSTDMLDKRKSNSNHS